MTALPPVAQTPPQLYCQLAKGTLPDDALQRIRDACLQAVRNTGPLLRGSGKPFACHLVGTASLMLESFPEDEALVIAALLHALYQDRVSGDGAMDAGRQSMREAWGEDVEALLHAYQTAGDPAPGMPSPGSSVIERKVRLLQLADQLEDALDGGPWWHGSHDDEGSERGCARYRADKFISLSALFEQAPALGAPRLLERYRAIRAEWEQGRWPDSLRSGQYSSFRAT
ncbi:MAG: hypothetical protein QM769_04830 [Pseudoxanthomonas sp.]